MRILVIEDEHRVANSIKKGLELESYAVDVAYDGQEGYNMAAMQDYDAIVLDLLLPKMNGIEVCRKLRDIKIHIPILMLTAKGQLEEKVEGFSAGADDYMVKPFAFIELLSRIKALTRRPKESLGLILTVGDLTLDTITYEVKRAGKYINLTRKEFALLEYLLRHKGKILTKSQIINNVWNYNDDILPNTVEAFIGYLRKKIEKPFRGSPPLINTIIGFGYSIGE